LAVAALSGGPAWPRPALAMAAVGAADGIEPVGIRPVPPAATGQQPTGDPEAFGALYDRYVDLVYRYVYYRVGTRALAEDLTSETFLRALRRITSFTWQGRDIGAWF